MDMTTLGAAIAVAKKAFPQVSSGDAGKLMTVGDDGKWLAADLEVGQGEVAVDSTLLVSGAAADAKVTGDKVAELKSAINTKTNEITTPSSNIYNTQYELGTIQSSTGAELPSTTVIRSGFIEVENSSSYIMYNLRDLYINMINPSQYICEYDADQNFLGQTAVYIATFTTGANTKFIRFVSNSYTDMADYVSDINTQKFQINKGPLLLKYESPELKTVYDEKFDGVDSDNIFDGVYDVAGVISNGSWNYWGTSVAVVTNPMKVNGTDLYFLLDNNISDFGMTYVQFYKEDGTYISEATATVPTVSTEIYVKHVSIPSNAKYATIMSTPFARSTAMADYEAFKEVVKNHLIVTENRDYSWTKINKTKGNKIDASLVNYGFLTDITNAEIRDFILTGLKQKTNEINAVGYDVVIPVMTDIHTFWHEPYAIMNWLERCGYCDAVANLGDNVPDHFDTKNEVVSFFNEIFSISNNAFGNVINLQGNHDTNPVNSTISDGSKMIKNAEYYAYSKERKIDMFVSNQNYGYVDIENAKVRVIFLDSSDIYNASGTPLIGGNNTLIQQGQLTWFSNVALNFTDKTDASEWAVITMAHERLNTLAVNDIFGQVLEAFTTGASLTMTDTKTVDGYTENLSVNVDYSAQGAITYICHVNGHYHEDNVVTFGDGFKQITVPTDTGTAYYYIGETRTAYDRTLMTVQEHCFDFLCLNKKNRTVTMKRFGVGSDRTFIY